MYVYTFLYLHSPSPCVLKECCEFLNIKYKTVLGYSKTSWLYLFPALTRLIDMLDGLNLKSYFLLIDKCPTIIKDFLTIHFHFEF